MGVGRRGPWAERSDAMVILHCGPWAFLSDLVLVERKVPLFGWPPYFLTHIFLYSHDGGLGGKEVDMSFSGSLPSFLLNRRVSLGHMSSD